MLNILAIAIRWIFSALLNEYQFCGMITVNLIECTLYQWFGSLKPTYHIHCRIFSVQLLLLIKTQPIPCITNIIHYILFIYGKRMDGVKTDYSSQKWCKLDSWLWCQTARIITHKMHWHIPHSILYTDTHIECGWPENTYGLPLVKRPELERGK